MDFLIDIFNTFLYQPLFNALVFLYEAIPGGDFGIAVIVLTIVIRVVLYPLMAQSIRAQKSLSELQPKLKELQEKYKDNKEQQAKEVMALYKRENVNPFGGCLPILIQIPVLIAMFQVFREGFASERVSSLLYSFISYPGEINTMFLSLIDLAEPSYLLALIAGVAQFVQSKMMMPKNKKKASSGDKSGQFAEMMQKQMLYMFPFFTFFILSGLPAAIGLYWIITAVFSIAQQHLIFKKKAEQTAPEQYDK